MAYLQRSAERRADVRRVLPSARTVIVTGTLYNTDRPYSTECADRGRAQIARYAWGDDYHDVIGARLDALLAWMREQSPEPFEARAYVDTGPVQERVYAQHAGLGWIGKNTLRDQPGDRIVDLSRRDHLQPAARARRAGARSVRHLHAVPRGVSDAGDRRARRARCDALHLVSDDRAARATIPDEQRARRSARTSTAATSARKSVRGTPRRRDRRDPAWQPRAAWDRVDLLTLARRTDEELHGRAAGKRDEARQGAGFAAQLAVALEQCAPMQTADRRAPLIRPRGRR